MLYPSCSESGADQGNFWHLGACGCFVSRAKNLNVRLALYVFKCCNCRTLFKHTALVCGHEVQRLLPAVLLKAFCSLADSTQSSGCLQEHAGPTYRFLLAAMAPPGGGRSSVRNVLVLHRPRCMLISVTP